MKPMNQERYNNFVKKLVFLNKNVNTYSVSQLVASIVDGFGIKDYYLDQSKRGSEVDKSSQSELVKILLTLSEQFTSVEELYNFWFNMYSGGSNGTQEEVEYKDYVNLNSIHKTKGNEFEHVALFNLAKRERERLTEVEMEEERRVVYVGVTRPISSLLITTPKGEISPFVREYFLNPELKESDDKSITHQLNKLQTETNVMQSELLNYDEEINKLREEYPEMNGERFIIEKPFKKFKEYIRKKRLSKSLSKYDELQHQKNNILNKIELKENDMKDLKNELIYRQLLTEGSSFNQLDELEDNDLNISQFNKNDNIKIDYAVERLNHGGLYATNESTEQLKVSEPLEKVYTINQSTKTEENRKINKIINKNEKKERPLNAGAAWTKQEEELLISRFKDGLSVKKIAEMHGRSYGGINARLRKVGLK